MNIANAVQNFIDAGIADGKAPRTIKDYRRILYPFSEWCAKHQTTHVTELTKDLIRAYSKHLREEKGWAESTWAIHIRTVRAFLRWIFEEGLVPENFALAIKSPKPMMKVETLPTEEEIKQLLSSINGKRFSDLRDLTMLLTFLDTGIRVGEMVLLSIGSWTRDGERSRLLIFAPKTKHQRYVFLGKRTTLEMESYLSAREERYGYLHADDALFVGKLNRPMTTSGIRRVINRRAQMAGLDPHRWHPHLFRKIFATTWLASGGGDFYLQYLAGWRSPEMIKIYAKLSPNLIQTAHEKVGIVDNLFSE